jgi:hypothetical protein
LYKIKVIVKNKSGADFDDEFINELSNSLNELSDSYFDVDGLTNSESANELFNLLNELIKGVLNVRITNLFNE